MSASIEAAAQRQAIDDFIAAVDTGDTDLSRQVQRALRGGSASSLPPAIQVAVARVWCGQGDPGKAAELVADLDTHALELNVRASRFIVLAEAVSGRDPAQAVAHAIEALRADPMATRASALGLQFALALGDVDQASTVLASTESKGLSQSPLLLTLAAQVHARQGQTDAAVNTARRALGLD